MPKLSELTKQLKGFALNQAISNEDFLNALISPYIIAGDIRNKNKEEYYLNKSRTSEIMNQKIEVPTELRRSLSQYEIKTKTIEEMETFIDDYLNLTKQTELLRVLSAMAQEEAILSEEDLKEINEQESLPLLITELLFRAISESNLSKAEVIVLWQQGLGSIDVQTGDLFHFGFKNRHKKKNIVVIPVNTAFDTHVTRKYENETYPLVSENTIHGQWLIRIEEAGEMMESLDKRISVSLERMGFDPVKETRKLNRLKRSYPIGSVAIIETDNAVYYLMAIAAFDDYNNARSTPSDIQSALTTLFTIYDRYGLGYEMYLPLMGTGLSRAGLSTQEAYDLLVEGMMNNRDFIHGQVHLILKPEDRKEIVINQEN